MRQVCDRIGGSPTLTRCPCRAPRRPHTSQHTGIVDVTTGNNSFAGVTGYNAVGGYDLASGWGTIDAYKFVHALRPLLTGGVPAATVLAAGPKRLGGQ